ncbi:MAG TPA: hypothetical protein VGK54_13770 [Chloroflexota bacterium]|jgi:hypothetical protein
MFSSLLQGMTITVRSPDGKIEWELENANSVTMEFTTGTYRRYTEPALEQQLAGLMKAIWSAHHQARLMVLSEMVGFNVGVERFHNGGRNITFIEERSRLSVQAISKTRCIQLTTTGMATWNVRIKEGTNRRLTEEEFLHDFWGAFLDLMTDYRAKVSSLKREMFPAPLHQRTTR